MANMKRARFFWCTNCNSNGLWFEISKGIGSSLECYKCKIVKQLSDFAKGPADSR